MSSNIHVNLFLGFFPMVILTLTLTLCFSDSVATSISTSKESESDPTCSFKCESSDDYETRLEIMDKMYKEYKKLKKTYEEYFGPTKNPMESWKKFMDQLDEIGPEAVLQFIQSLSGESRETKTIQKKKKKKPKKNKKESEGEEDAEDSKSSVQKDADGWTTIQKRSSGPLKDFDRDWAEYKNGFGSLEKNFWIGLERIRAFTKNGDQELRIELEDFEGQKRWAEYSNFSISDASDFYRLSISGYSGDAGNDLIYPSSLGVHNGMQFSTKDKDNDKQHYNCAVRYSSGWWYNCCFRANLNGPYREKRERFPDGEGIIWHSWKGVSYSLAKTEMKIRKRK